MTSHNLYLFLNNIPETSKASASSRIYVTYQCSYGSGCYQILIPHGQEHKALLLLLGENFLTSELPVTQLILNGLRPKPFLSSLVSHSYSDEEYSVALDIMQRCIMKKGNVLLEDFDEPIRKIIQKNNGLKQSFISTVDFFKKNVEIRTLLDSIFPTVLTDTIMDYNNSHSKFRI